MSDQKMNKNTEAKVAAVADIVAKLKDAKSVIIVKNDGLTVGDVTALRKQCREQDVHYCVLKNKLVKRALDEQHIEGIDDLLNGPNAFVFSMKDAVSGPKVVSEFIEKNKIEKLTVTGGLLDSKAVDVATIEKLAKMPSREVLLARLVGSMNATIGNFVRVVEAIRKQKAGE